MKHNQGVAEKTPVYMGVDLCRHYRFMPKHFLNCPKVSSGFYHVCRKGVTKGMRTYLFQYACLPRKISCYGKYH